MAKIGFEYTVIGKLSEDTDGTPSYSDSMYMGPNAAFNVTVNSNDVKDYGDDRVVETDTSVIDGTISVEHNELTLEQEAYMLGHTLGTSGQIVYNDTDEAPFLGIGIVGKSKRSGSRVYTAKVYYKTQFREPSDENATKQDSTTFTHTTLEGNMYTLKNGDWKTAQEFTSLSDAKDFLDELFGVEAETGETETTE